MTGRITELRGRGMRGQRGARGNPGGNVMSIGTFADAVDLVIPVGADLVTVSGHDAVGDEGAGDQYVYDASIDAAYVAAHPDTSFIDNANRGFRLVARGTSGGGTSGSLDMVSIDSFPEEDADDGNLLERFLRARAPVVDAGKTIYAPKGQYTFWQNGRINGLTDGGLLVDNFKFKGAGVDQTFLVAPNDKFYMFYTNGNDTAGTPQNPSIMTVNDPRIRKNMEFSHFTATQSDGSHFLEVAAVFGLFGVDNVHIHHFKIDGFAGDAIRIGTAENGDGSEINENGTVTISDGIIDGKNKNTRQAITIDNCATLIVTNVQVLNCTRPGNGNVTPEQRDDINTGPPMPGAMDYELINGSMFTVTMTNSAFTNWTVINNGGAALVYNFGKGNRVNPPFDGQNGNAAADISTVISGHRATNVYAERCRLGLISADAPPQAAVPFDVKVNNFTCLYAGRSMAITRFNGLKLTDGTFYRSDYAAEFGYIGDVNKYVKNVTLKEITWIQNGVVDGLTMRIYGCDGFKIIDNVAIDNRNVFMAISGENKTRNLLVNGLEFQASGAAGAPVTAISAIVVPNPGESLTDAINRLVDVDTVEFRNMVLNGVAEPNFPSRNGNYPNVPRIGAWKANRTLYCSSDDPGAPEGWRTQTANTLPTLPDWRLFGRKGNPAADAILFPQFNYDSASAGLIKSTNGRFTSTGYNQYAADTGNAVQVGVGLGGDDIWFRGAYDRTSMIFIGWNRGTSFGTLTDFTGVWLDGGYGGSQQRVLYVGGTQRGLYGAFSHEISTRMRLFQHPSLGPIIQLYSGTPNNWTPNGAPIALTGDLNSFRRYILFGSAGESVAVQYANNQAGNS